MRIRSRLLTLPLALTAAFGLFPSAANASSVLYVRLNFIDPVLELGDLFANTVVTGPTSIGDYSFAGEFCEDASCTTPTGSSAYSLLRLTNMTLTCNSGTGDPCAPIDVTFEATNATIDGEVGDPEQEVLLAVNLSGSGSASGYVRVCVADSTSFCTSEASGQQSLEFSFLGSIFGSGSRTLLAPSGYDVYGVFHIDGLDDGASVILNNSLDVGIEPSSIPEPSTLALAGAGLLACVAFRRRRSFVARG